MMNEEEALKRIKQLIELLKYYDNLYELGTPEVSDYEYDKLYFELVGLENDFNIYFDDSPTSKIHYEVKNELNKVVHNHSMLSLDKTKEMREVYNFIGDKAFVTMLKMDGLTCSLRYLNGRLVSAETRGNGEVGEDILHNVLTIKNIPKRINYTDELIVDGEVICKYEDFEKFKDEYQNPRNFAAGSIRLLDSAECAKRDLTFIAWEVVKGFEDINSVSERFIKLGYLGFTIVPFLMGDDWDAKEFLVNQAKELSYPIDGLVFKFDDIEYGNSLGATGHHKKNAIAFKFEDETYDSRLKHITWSIGRTGTLTPIAIFDPVEIDFTIVERASLHNVSAMRDTLGDCAYVGEPIRIFKANQIIPQIMPAEEEYKYNYGYVVSHGGVSANDAPELCPYCGNAIKYEKSSDGVVVAKCTNDDCVGKLIAKLDYFCSKNGLDIKYISEAIIEDLIGLGLLQTYKDIFELHTHKMPWIMEDGYGEASVMRILYSIEDAKETTLNKFISALGIDLIGPSVAKDLCKVFKTYEDFRNACQNNYQFEELDNFGEAKANSLRNYNFTEADTVYDYLTISNPLYEDNAVEKPLEGITFVVTGSLNHYSNRDELKAEIEKFGGKVSGSVSKKTNYLINNDITSTSSKNQKAQALGIEILTEDAFIRKFIDFSEE